MKVDVARLAYQKDEKTTLQIYEVPLSSLVLDSLANAICDHFWHIFCSPPEWAYEVRWGPKDEEFEIADKSLGHHWFNFGQWVLGFEDRGSRRIGSIPVSFDWVKEHMPDAGWPWDGSDSEDEETGSPDEQDKVN